MTSRSSRGFTLIEIMVVVVLIGVAATFISINMGRDVGRLVTLEARQFQALVNHLREESVVTGRILGIMVNGSENSYHFVEYSDGWKESTEDQTLRKRTLRDGVKFAISPGPNAPKDMPPGLVMVEPMGAVTPFIVKFSGGDKNVTVTVDEDEDIVLKEQARS